MHVGAGKNPGPIAFSEENVAARFDPLQCLAIRATANSLCRQQTRAFAISFDNLFARFFEPITTNVRLWFDPFAVNGEERIDIFVAQLAP